MNAKSDSDILGFLGTAFWLGIVFAVFIIVPVLIAIWIAGRVYPLPAGPRNGNVLGELLEKRSRLSMWLTAGFLVVMIVAALLSD